MNLLKFNRNVQFHLVEWEMNKIFGNEAFFYPGLENM